MWHCISMINLPIQVPRSTCHFVSMSIFSIYLISTWFRFSLVYRQNCHEQVHCQSPGVVQGLLEGLRRNTWALKKTCFIFTWAFPDVLNVWNINYSIHSAHLGLIHFLNQQGVPSSSTSYQATQLGSLATRTSCQGYWRCCYKALHQKKWSSSTTYTMNDMWPARIMNQKKQMPCCITYLHCLAVSYWKTPS